MAAEDGAGQIFTALEQTGQLDRTVMVFTSDHGYFYGEHCLSVERRLAYEEAIRIPLLIRYPPLIRPGTTFDQFVLSIDLAPTLLELGRARLPEMVHGRSFAPLLRNEKYEPRRSFLIEYFTDKVFPRVQNMGYQAVRTDRWKYIHYRDLPNSDELYDLASDPYELKNLAGDPAQRPALARLQDELARLLAETSGQNDPNK
jgi:N-acetylglucosamine-6-sulfatase